MTRQQLALSILVFKTATLLAACEQQGTVRGESWLSQQLSCGRAALRETEREADRDPLGRSHRGLPLASSSEKLDTAFRVPAAAFRIIFFYSLSKSLGPIMCPLLLRALGNGTGTTSHEQAYLLLGFFFFSYRR